MLLLRPSKRSNDLFQYILAVAAEKYGIQLHAYCVMSNHFHCVLTDPRGNLPKFEQYLDGLVARSFNALHGRWESFWAPGSYSAVRLLSPGTILAKAVYVLVNSVEAGLVRRVADWPGLWAGAGLTSDAEVELQRPEGFFRPDGPLPPTVKLQLTCPPGFASAAVFGAKLQRAVTAREDRAAAARGARGAPFLGARRVLAQRPTMSPASVEPRRGLSPRIAGRDRWKRIEALTRLKEFVVAYREAWRAFARGVRDVVFPRGTYWMRVAHGVRCAA